MTQKKHPYYDDSMWKGAPSKNFSYAQELRDNMTNAELILWDKLKNKQFFGHKFRRQHPIQKYIADFYCHKLKLIIEIDGGYHNNSDQKIYDKERAEDLNFQGVEVIRFTNEEVEKGIEGVLKILENYISK